jgi:hypothetical protein
MGLENSCNTYRGITKTYGKRHMHYQRIFYVFIVFFAYFNQSFAIDDTERRIASIKNYMDFAFLTNTRIVKFSEKPKVTLHCDRIYCLSISQEVIKHLPKFIASQIVSSNSQDSGVNIYFSASDQKNIQNEIALNPVSGSELFKWGVETCHVEVLRRGDVIEKVSISVAESEGKQLNVGCILYEVLRASGGSMKEHYEEYAPKISQLSEDKMQLFYAGIEFILRIHWSEIIPPGTNKYETQKLVEQYMQ